MDIAAHGNVLTELLRRSGWEVLVAPSAEAALDLLFEGLPSVLLAVDPLPDGSAVELVAALRRLPGGDAPGVLVITADPSGGDDTVDRWVHPTARVGALLGALSQVASLRGLPVPGSSGPVAADARIFPPPPSSASPPPPTVAAPNAVAAVASAPARTPPPPASPSPAPDRSVSPLSDHRARSREGSHGAIPAQLLSREARDRMAREVELLERGDPWSALGVPRRSPRDLVDRAAARMEARYAPYLAVPDPVFQDLARRMLACVRAAHERVTAGVTDDAATPGDRYAHGHALLDAHRWAEADAFFSLKREESPDSAVCLAGEGWARYNNPERDAEEREADGVALMELAVQIDAGLDDTQARLARIAHRAGEADTARARARLAIRANPRHAEALALLHVLGERGAR